MPTNDDVMGRMERGINRLNDILDLLLDSLEKGPRKDTPSSMYFRRRRDDMTDEIRNISNSDFKKFVDLEEKELDELRGRTKTHVGSKKSDLETKIQRYEAAMLSALEEGNNAAYSVLEAQQRTSKQELENLKKQHDALAEIEELTRAINDETDEATKNTLIRVREEKLNKEVGGKTVNKIYEDYQSELNASANKSSDAYALAKENEAYEARSNNLQNISQAISHSGFGGSSFGRSLINMANRQQKISSLGNFGANLNNPASSASAANITKGLMGTGKAANKAAGLLGKFGGLLSGASKILGGPFMAVLSIVIDALKAVGKVANEYQKQTAMFIRYQTEMERISYEQSKQHSVLTTQIDIETVKYIGDMALKLMETQGANMLEAMDILNAQFVKSMEIGTGSLMKGINQTAYDAAMASIDAGASMRKMEKHQEQRQTQMELYGAQRGFEAEKNIASAISDINVADATAAVERLSKANELEQNQLDMAAGATGSLISGDLGGAIANGIGFFRDAENNTTTGEKASGNTNSMNASKVKVDTYKAFGVDKIPGWDSSLVGPNAVGAATMGLINGGDRSGYREKETAIVENAAQQITQDADAVKTKTDLHYSKAGAELENRVKLAEKETDMVTQAAEKTIDAATAVEKNWLALTQHIEGFIEKFDKRFNDLALNMGLINQGGMFDYKQRQFSIIANVARSFGKTEDEIARYQSSYVDETGRNKMFGLMDTRQLSALGTYLGDDGLATRFASEMEIFNAGASESVDLLDKTLQNVNKIGLNGRKYTKDLVNNLKLAQKYNFVGGTKAVMEMAKWAQKTRFNMQSLSGMIDKIQEGGLEGVIQQSAGFQVLGGMAAINSDPLGMLYDAWADPESLAKRYQGMTKGLGTLDRETGETKFNQAESMQIAQIAKLQGRSVEEVRGEIMERNKREVVNNQLSSAQRRNFDQDQLDYLGSVAKYNRKSQQFEVTLANGETRGINEITPEELKQAMPQEHEERMETWMEQLVSIVSKMSGETVAENAEVASAVYKQTLDSFNTRLQEMHESYLKNFSDFTAHISEEQGLIEKSVKDYLTQFAENMHNDTTGINAEVSNIKGKANAIAQALGGVAEIISTAKTDIAKAAGMDISGMNGARNTDAINNAANERVGKSKTEQKNSRTPDPNNYQNYVWNKTVVDVSGYNKRTGTFNGNNYAPTDAATVAINQVPPYRHVNDGVVDAGDESSMIGAKHIVPINDGSLDYAKPDKSDIGMVFAKQGGPFDTLFNGIFDEIHITSNKIDTLLSGFEKFTQTYVKGLSIAGTTEIHHERRVEADTDYLAKLYDAWSDPQEYAKRTETISRNEDNDNSNIPSKKDVNVNINGRLMLDSGNQSVDLMTLINTNPELVRKITEAVILQMSSNANGGKYEMFGGNRYYV